MRVGYFLQACLQVLRCMLTAFSGAAYLEAGFLCNDSGVFVPGLGWGGGAMACFTG